MRGRVGWGRAWLTRTWIAIMRQTAIVRPSTEQGRKHVATSISEVINRRAGIAAARRRFGVRSAGRQPHPNSHSGAGRDAAQPAGSDWLMWRRTFDGYGY